MPAREPDAVRARVHVSGLVQGVGFRPFVWREATALGLSGWVGNDAAGVVLEVEGSADGVASLLEALRRPPALARVDDVRSERVPPVGGDGFAVRTSDTGGARLALVSPDTATCRDCLAELRDATDRRAGYAFTNCTNCGPRYTMTGASMPSRSAALPAARRCVGPPRRRRPTVPVCAT